MDPTEICFFWISALQWALMFLINRQEQTYLHWLGTEEAVEEQFKSTENFGHTQTVWDGALSYEIDLCFKDIGYSKPQRILELHHWLKVMAIFAERFDFAYWWTCIGKGLLAAIEAGLYWRHNQFKLCQKHVKPVLSKRRVTFESNILNLKVWKFIFDLLSQIWPKIRQQTFYMIFGKVS